MTEAPTITALAPWFGAARMIAKQVGEALRGCKWVGVPFAGGMAELLHIEARTMLVNDLHGHVINLARTVADPIIGPKLYRRLRRAPFHPWTLETAQQACATYEASHLWSDDARLNFAEMYFITCWMGRGGNAGTDREFQGNLPIRWNAAGGDSCKRFRSAVDSLRVWRKVLERCSFTQMDAFQFLAEAKERDYPEHGLYIDAPWPSDGGSYRHKFTEHHQRSLANVLTNFQQARIVIRYGDHPLIRELYSGPRWAWQNISGRTQANKEKAEVLIVSQR